MEVYDVCILGGGAAGLAAAASLDNDIRVCLLEKNKAPGRKIMATGGGRCNITNEACGNKVMTLDFFNALGLELYHDEEGRYFPYSNQAADVVRILENALAEKNIEIVTSFTASHVSADSKGFHISDEEKTITAAKLVLTTGGKAAPQMGTTGDGYVFARRLGHKVEKVYPILTGLKCMPFDDIKGVRAKGEVSLYKDGRLLKAERGEIQFTEDGISGICVFNLTLLIKAEEGEMIDEALGRYSLKLDMAPDFTEEEIRTRNDSFGILSYKLAQRVAVENIKNWQLPIAAVKGWKEAQCTAGGVCLDEINVESMESKLIRGLYFAGEIINRQGPCGGFNLQNAWETGIKAAKAINEAMRR